MHPWRACALPSVCVVPLPVSLLVVAIERFEFGRLWPVENSLPWAGRGGSGRRGAARAQRLRLHQPVSPDQTALARLRRGVVSKVAVRRLKGVEEAGWRGCCGAARCPRPPPACRRTTPEGHHRARLSPRRPSGCVESANPMVSGRKEQKWARTNEETAPRRRRQRPPSGVSGGGGTWARDVQGAESERRGSGIGCGRVRASPFCRALGRPEGRPSAPGGRPNGVVRRSGRGELS